MNAWIEKRNPSQAALLQAALIFLAVTWLNAAIVHANPQDRSSAVGAALLMGLGLMAIAARLQSYVRTPRWSLFASTGVMAVALVAAEFVASSPAAGRQSMMWMFPWYFATMSMYGPASARRACASPARAGRILLGTSIILGTGWVILAIAGVHL